MDPDEEYDPFERLQWVLGDEGRTKQKADPVSWSYSSYIKALDKEEVMNNVDHKTFANARRSQYTYLLLFAQLNDFTMV